LADPGGICISRTAYDQVKKKLNIDYKYLGEYEVKNIDEPVRVYRIQMEPEAVTRKAPVISAVEKAPKTIAVIPFVNLSPDPDQEYFVDGLTEELLNSLTKIPDLLVTARTSSFSFKGKDKTIQEIASVLRVDNILEGSVRKAGNALRITAQLVRAADGFHLWSETYNRELKDIFVVQEDIAKAVANELKITLGIVKSLKLLGGTENLEAYERYLVAQGLFNKTLEGGDLYTTTKHTLDSVDTAVALDPKFALAWAYKSRIHYYLSLFGPANRADAEQDDALSAALKAIELEPNLADGYHSLGCIQSSRGKFIEAESSYNKGLELKNDTYSHMYVHYWAVGNFEKGKEILEELLRNDPLHLELRGHYLWLLSLDGNMQRAEEEYKRGRALFGDEWFWGNLGITQLRLGNDHSISRDEIVFSNPIYDSAKEHLDSPKEALAELRRLYDDIQIIIDFFNISICAAYFGDPEFSMDSMEKLLRINAFHFCLCWLPVMKDVRQLPRFKEFVREIGLVDYWNEFGWPDICRPLDNGDFECD
jgi:TolB-like protein